MIDGHAGKYLTKEAPSLFFALANFAKSATIETGVQFADVSFWQGDIDWSIYKDRSIATIVRAGQGSWPDVKFVRNWSEAKKWSPAWSLLVLR